MEIKGHRQKTQIVGQCFVTEADAKDFELVSESLAPAEVCVVLESNGFQLIEKHINFGKVENGFVPVSYQLTYTKGEGA